MYEIIKSVINEGRYELADILAKIDTIWIQGDITEEQKTELVLLAQEKAKPENSYAPIQKQVDTLFTNMAEIAEQVGRNILDIQSIKKKLEEEGTEIPEPEPEPGEEWPEYVAPTGAHDAYNTGDKVTYKGKHYICQMDGCVWDPETYPQGWREETEKGLLI